MNKCREEFEQVCYQNKWNIFKDSQGSYFDDFVNGAWWVWQEQQKRIDAVTELLIRLEKMRKDGVSGNLDAFQSGYWGALEYVAKDLEQALKGEG